MRSHLRATAVAVATCAVLVVGLTAAAAPAGASTTPTMVVIGDSITSRHNDTVGSASRGWWSYLGSKLELRVIRHAVRGSGYGKRGKANDGTDVCGRSTFRQRLENATVAQHVKAARVVIVEGGINDYMTCVRKDGEWDQVRSTESEVKVQIHATMVRLAELRASAPSSVYVTAPFGPFAPADRTKAWILPFLKAEAEAAGFHYVDTAHGTLYGDRTSDKVHPNAAGNVRLYRDLYTNGAMYRWGAGFKGMDAPAPPTSGAPVAPRTP
ncbi:SGNH/GDSL hydrolase family protein [Aeromicrobium sp. Root344]|uniref:SGNH/GDSL hydrolase family protein n=1 Tax=Aeromicrobium sp. Root344 TaxID=1736521 RepID=UPI0009E93416|nr:SGNH/GDSL hydrolase family protein [Aeromicrobium sp. Root344]